MKTPEEKLRAQVAVLESKLDLFESELSYLDDLLRSCGFAGGIATLKSTVEELIAETRSDTHSGEIDL